ncbi:winged helix-turn-helix transcriptional regulator [Streptomyces lancefieldiae]|uniref:Helix-turn-helix domain-containing protein n=1 Tax=Streptomyces lancefieldiae TaxID=3075520 RepID=A0ABU3ATK7_9ACTN|nr:helix-turn-helix domain-containing protein [Streptomyces sp. DSM 40712]MDT0613491.1 helix-turn-helix domain-containing protein [Streptomyces sp. DSM 40712]
MTTERHDAARCAGVGGAVERVFVLLGKRWNGVILASLMNGPGRFAELRRAVNGISERMLSDRLAELGEAGLVSREVDAGPPLRVSYRLTPAGEALRPALAELGDWAERFLGASEEGGCPTVRQPQAADSRNA